MTNDWNRKNEHIHYAQMHYQENSTNGLDHVRFVHQSFSNISVEDVNLSTQLGSLSLDYPFFINAMTGGSDKAETINQNLALIAKETNLAMAVGSVSTALSDPSLEASFKIVRQTNPNGVIFSNIGAHHSVENAKKAVALIEANALQIHVNTPQELIMPEGDRDFTNWLSNIEEIVSHIDVPVIVKEVGFGMSKETIEALVSIGVTVIDISGRGGTNFVHIENQRREKKEFSYLLNWGQTTAESLLETKPFQDNVDFIASGGIRTALDMLLSFGLGANAVGLSGEFLHLILTQDNTQTIERINDYKKELTTLMTLIGAKSIHEIKDKPIVLSADLHNWCLQRQISI